MEAAANRIQPVVLRRLEVRDRCSDMDRGSQLFRVACRSFPEVRGSDACCRSQRQASRAQGLPNQKEKIGIGLRCSWPDCGRCYRDRKSSFAGKTTQGARGCGFQPQSWSIEIVFSIQARRASEWFVRTMGNISTFVSERFRHCADEPLACASGLYSLACASCWYGICDPLQIRCTAIDDWRHNDFRFIVRVHFLDRCHDCGDVLFRGLYRTTMLDRRLNFVVPAINALDRPGNLTARYELLLQQRVRYLVQQIFRFGGCRNNHGRAVFHGNLTQNSCNNS